MSVNKEIDTFDEPFKILWTRIFNNEISKLSNISIDHALSTYNILSLIK